MKEHYSDLLNLVLAHSRDLEVGIKGTVTPEKLLLAVFNMQEHGNLNDEETEELSAAIALLNDVLPDTAKAKKTLFAFADGARGSVEKQVRYMNSILAAADAAAGKHPDGMVTLGAVLATIFSFPTENLQKCVDEQQEGPQKAEEPEKEKSDSGLGWLSGAISAFNKGAGAVTGKQPGGTAEDGKTQQATDARKPRKNTASEGEKTEGSTEDGNDDSEPQNLTELVRYVHRIRDNLMTKVFGQDHAIDVVTNGLFHGEYACLTDKERRRPKATFLFAGSPGVGKTFLAESLAEEIHLPFFRFDMSEMDPTVMDKKVPTVMKQHPKCVLLFDEIEKTHSLIIQEFLQVLDLGQFGGNRGVSFKDAVIIFTTNAGAPLYNDAASGDFSEVSVKTIMKALRDDKNNRGEPYFPPAMISRFETGNVVMFNRMDANTLLRITKKEMNKQIQAVETFSDATVVIDDLVYAALLIAHGGNADARVMRAKAETFISSEMYELYRLLDSANESPKKVHISVNLDGAPANIQDLFSERSQHDVLLFGDEALCESCAAACPSIRFHGFHTVESAMNAVNKKDFKFALIDFGYGIRQQSHYLNDEDIISDGREFFRQLKKNAPELPIYFIQTPEESYNHEERLSLRRRGVRDVIELGRDSTDEFRDRMAVICEQIHHQDKMMQLARAGKTLAFETGQYLTDDNTAEIELFDFRLEKVLVGDESKRILSDSELPTTRFKDVVGAKAAKEALQDYVEFLRDPKGFAEKNLEVQKGVLLYGPPGTGKTMLARALAGEAGVAFLPVSGTEFFKPLVGLGPEAIRNVFRTARNFAPAVIFIDEVDAIAKERTGSEFSGHEEELLNTLLVEMDGFAVDPKRPVFVLAATNSDVDGSEGSNERRGLDKAILRRFDRRIKVDLPSKDERLEYLRLKTEGDYFRISEDAYNNIAGRSSGMSPADLESFIKLVKQKAVKAHALYIDDVLFDEAFEEFQSGEKRERSPETMLKTARHESGHAFINWYFGDKPTYATVVSRGSYGGYVQRDSGEERTGYNRTELRNMICGAMAGRAAEIVYYGPEKGITTGPSADLKNATHIAVMMLCSYGMIDNFGMAVTSPYEGNGAMLRPEIREEVNTILGEELQRAVELITAHKEAMDALVDELMQKTHLNGEEIDAILSQHATPEA